MRAEADVRTVRLRRPHASADPQQKWATKDAKQLDEPIWYANGRNINKVLKQGLLTLRKSATLAKNENDFMTEEQSVIDAHKDERSTQTRTIYMQESGARNHAVRRSRRGEHKLPHDSSCIAKTC